jgi:hypothetical protein
MNDHRPDPHGPTPEDARLSELISDAVSGVEPGDGLTAIRSRTRPNHLQESRMNSNRSWMYAVGGAIAGVAAVAAMIVVVSQINDDGDPPLANQPESSQTSEPTGGESTPSEPSDTPTSSDPTGQPTEGAVPVYYAGDGGRCTVLYREFQPGTGDDPVSQAAYAAVAGPARDADYRSLWPAGTEATASYDGDVITVDLTGADLHDLPAGMSEEDAGLAIQQVVYSVQGAARERAGVQFLLDGQRTDQVLGQPASEPLANASISATLSQMNITQPEEGMTVSGGTLKAEGVANTFEATFQWEIRQGDQVVLNDFGMADGCCEPDKLFPWKLSIDVSSLEPGTYTFVATNDDPSDGEGFPPATDSKTFVIE